MSHYIVTARKYRPTVFEEIIGQGHVTRTLMNAVAGGRVAQAYLFSGPRGVGKTTAARILARALNCEKGPTPTPCNACASCEATTRGSSVDVLEIDGASNTGVENVRELRENVMYMPGAGRYKVYIIDEVHMLSDAAFNALLKTLEEPPPHVVFIFATTEVHRIPLTILSRCQRFDFRRITFREIKGRLEEILATEKIDFEEDALGVIAREADGSLRDALSLLDQVLAFGGGAVRTEDVASALGLMDRGLMMDLLGAVVGGDARACLNIVEKMHNFGYDLKRACSGLVAGLRDLLVLRTTGTGELVDAPESELERLKGLASTAGLERLQTLFSIISRGYEEVSRSAYPRYSFEMALVRAASFERVFSITELLERLESLERAPKTPQRRGPSGQGRPATKERKATDPDRKRPDGAAEKKPAGHARSGPDLVDFIRERDRALAIPLEGASLVVEGDTVRVKVAPGGFNFLKNVKKDRLAEILGAYFKRPVNVEIVSEDAGTTDVKDPVKEVIRILGGRVIEDRYGGTNV